MSFIEEKFKVKQEPKKSAYVCNHIGFGPGVRFDFNIDANGRIQPFIKEPMLPGEEEDSNEGMLQILSEPCVYHQHLQDSDSEIDEKLFYFQGPITSAPINFRNVSQTDYNFSQNDQNDIKPKIERLEEMVTIKKEENS